MRTTMIPMLVLAFIASTAFATSETPESKLGVSFQPYAFGLGYGTSPYIVSSMDQGFAVEDLVEYEGDADNSCGVIQWTPAIANPKGSICIYTHGLYDAPAVEAYVTEALRDDAWDWLEDFGFNMSMLYKSYSVHGHSISMYDSAISSYFVSAKTIVYNWSCYGQQYESAWNGARVRMGYPSTCNLADGWSDMLTIWPRLAGSESDERTIDGATDGTRISVDGNDDTTLSPYVKSVTSGSQVPWGGKEITVEFDTETNRGSSPFDISGPFTVQSAVWESDSKLTANVIPSGEGEGYLTVLGSVVASKNCGELYLDGGEDWEIRIHHSSNPAASVHGFGYSNGTLRWKASSLFDTDHFRVEAAADVTGSWTTAADHILASSGHASVSLNSVDQYYRLVEVETDGTELVHGIASRDDARMSVSAPVVPSTEEMRIAIDGLNAQRQQGGSYGGELPMSSSTLTIYTTPSLEEAVQYAIADYWYHWFGIETTVVTTDVFPQTIDGIRNGIDLDIDARAANGETAFLLIGDANDHVQFTGTEYPELWLPENGWESIRQGYLAGGYQDQSNNDLIPTFYFPDTLPRDENQGWLTPYWFSDVPYSDVDNADGILRPDVLVTRLPFTTEDEVYAYGYKLQSYNGGWYGAQNVSFFVGNLDHGRVTGQSALDIAEAVESILPGGLGIGHVYESQYPAAAQRNTAAANHWNSYTPEVLFIPSSYSNRSWPGNFFDQTNSVNPWHMGMIQTSGTHQALVVAGACDGADFPRTEDSDYGLPIGHRFLSAWMKGAIAWVGPTAGTWQEGNALLMAEFAEILFENPTMAMGEAFRIAQRHIVSWYEDMPEIRDTAMSYVFLGDPLVPMNRAMVPVDVAADGSSSLRLELGQNHPNPAAGLTTINFQLPSQSDVDLSVYDVAGRKVLTLIHGVQEAGSHQLRWDTTHHQGQQIATGMYFYRLKTEGSTLERKLLLIR